MQTESSQAVQSQPSTSQNNPGFATQPIAPEYRVRKGIDPLILWNSILTLGLLGLLVWNINIQSRFSLLASNVQNMDKLQQEVLRIDAEVNTVQTSLEETQKKLQETNSKIDKIETEMKKNPLVSWFEQATAFFSGNKPEKTVP